MSMKTTLGIATLAVIAFLVAGIAYWALRENLQLVAPSGSAGAPPVAPEAPAPPAPPASQSASPAPQSQATAPLAPAPSSDRTVQPTRGIDCPIASGTPKLTGKRRARATTSAAPSTAGCPDDKAAC